MRGGFHHQRKVASFSDTDVEGQLSDVEEKLGSTESRLDKLMREKTGHEQKIIMLRKEKLDLEGDVAKLEKLLHLGGDDLDATKRQKEELTSRLAEIEKKLQDVQDRVGNLNKDLAASKSAKEQLRLKVSQLRSPQLLAEIHAFDEARQKIKEQVLGMQNEIQNMDVRVTTMLIPEKQRIEQLLKGHDKEQTSFTSELEQLKTTIDSDSTQLVVKEKSQRAFFSAYKDLFHKRDELSAEINAADGAVEKLRDSSRKIEIEMNTQSLKLAALASELAGLQTQMNYLKNAKILRGKSEEELKVEMGKFEHMLANMSAVNMKALEIYEQVEVEYGKLVEKKETLLKEKVDVVTLMDEIESKKKEQFMRTFDELNTHFQEKFASLTTKGKAFLILENKEKPFDAGLDIRINTTGKRFMDIRSLSGGEKSMTALAFYFAVQEHEPHSFYLMDEVDAALDKHNSERLAHLIQQYGKNAQYIVVSHNDSLISEADYLYGVSMDEFGTSKVVSLKV
jgi:chromosome segregation protein